MIVPILKARVESKKWPQPWILAIRFRVFGAAIGLQIDFPLGTDDLSIAASGHQLRREREIALGKVGERAHSDELFDAPEAKARLTVPPAGWFS